MAVVLTLSIAITAIKFVQSRSPQTGSLAEFAICEQHKSLFYDVEPAKEAFNLWERFLPRYVKTQMDRYSADNQAKNQVETEMPFDFERFNMLGPLGPNCRIPIEKYGEHDEEKRACNLSEFQSKTNITHNSECVVYSVGSNNQWKFEEAIVEKTSCRVETFDCTIPETTLPPESIRHRVRFHNYCISDKDEGKYKTWKSLHKITGLVGAPTFLKMDIEGYEFPSMINIIDSGEKLPLQIAMEIHTERMEGGRYQHYHHVSSAELISFMSYMHNYGGYYLIDRRDNGKACSEFLLAKLDCHNHPLVPGSYHMLAKQNHTLFAESIKYSLNAKYYN